MEKQPWCHSGNNTCFLQYLHKWGNLGECETKYDCSLRNNYYKYKGENIMGFQLGVKSATAVNGIDLSGIETLIIDRFTKTFSAFNNYHSNMNALSEEVKQLRIAVNKTIEETKQLNAAFLLASKTSTSTVSAVKPIEMAKNLTEINLDDELVIEINAATDVDELRDIFKSNRDAFPNMLTPRGIQTLKNLRERMIANLLEVTKTKTPAKTVEVTKENPVVSKVISIETWAKHLDCNLDRLTEVVAACKASKDVLCKTDFGKISEYLELNSLPERFISWLESNRQSAQKK